jgi:hypothetical protein
MRSAPVTQTPIDAKILRSIRTDLHTSVFRPGNGSCFRKIEKRIQQSEVGSGRLFGVSCFKEAVTMGRVNLIVSDSQRILKEHKPPLAAEEELKVAQIQFEGSCQQEMSHAALDRFEFDKAFPGLPVLMWSSTSIAEMDLEQIVFEILVRSSLSSATG